MSRLLDITELERLADSVDRETRLMLVVATDQLARLRNAEGDPREPLVRYWAEAELARIARALQRAQCVLVHPTDHRYHAAQAVLAYCDQADARAPAAPPIALGAVT